MSMPKKINVQLSVSSINQAIQEVQQYKTELNRKVTFLCRRLSDLGQITAVKYAGQSPLGNTVKITTNISSTAAGCKAVVVAVGQTKISSGYEPVNTLLLIEFGAGIRYNPLPNPKAGEYGMGVGTYPGQMHAFDPAGLYYWGEDEKWHHSYGVKATMPMYNAAKTIQERVVQIAREVFSS